VSRLGGAVPSFPWATTASLSSICAVGQRAIVHGIPFVVPGAGGRPTWCRSTGGAILDVGTRRSGDRSPIGAVPAADLALSAACEAALHAGIAAVRPDARLSDVSHAVQTACAEAGRRDGVPYGIVAEYGGHGIGTAMHMDPFLPNFGDPGQGPRLRPGMALAIEPMLTAGEPETRELDDGWTVVTADGARAVHWEHSVAITEDGPRILTLPA
jgi:methionyl aminopeptidase